MTTAGSTTIRIARIATVANALLALVLLLLAAMMLLHVPVSGDSILDVPAFVLALSWLVVTPVTALAGAVASRRAAWPAAQWFGLAVGALWIASLAYLATLH